MGGKVVETFGFSRYVEDEAHLAYRLIHYNQHTGIIYMFDQIASNNAETNELTQFTRNIDALSNS